MSAADIKIIAYVVAVLCGLCVGSFLNVVIYRLPNGMSIVKPPSHCPKCGHKLKWYDNIPVLSYIILGGRCRECGEHISFRYTIVELLNAALWILCVLLFWDKCVLYAVAAAIACSLLICIAFIDLETLYMFDILTYLIAVPVIMMTISSLAFGYGAGWTERLIGAAASGAFFAAAYFIGKLALKREAMGVGDIIFEAFTGALLGWKAWLFALVVSSVSAAVVMLPISLAVKNKDGGEKEFPFAPALAFGTAAAMFFAEPVINFYLGLF